MIDWRNAWVRVWGASPACASRNLLLPALLFGAFASNAAAADSLIEALRDGGYNLYFRHAATEWSQSDRVVQAGDWLSCDAADMRQLSTAGRADSIAVGNAMRALRIPVGEILASPYCRTVETAELLNLGVVIPTTAVVNLRVAEYFGGRNAIVARARALLATPPPKRSNRVVVAHGNVAREATPVYPGEGEAVVFRPDGRGGFDLIGRITPSRWAAAE